MLIRPETPADLPAIHQLVTLAFASAAHSDGTEQDLVDALRAGGHCALSLVAVQDNEIVGHVLFSPATVGSHPVAALAPLAVHPDCQRQGIGSALVREGHRQIAALGYDWSVVLGSETYYPRFGYQPACALGIRAPFDVPDENFMAIRLRPDAPALSGVMQYAPEFGI